MRDRNTITSEGLSRPLSYGERRCLEQARKNRELSSGTREEVEQRQAAAAVDVAMKTPRRTTY
jgi:hypothetical protein